MYLGVGGYGYIRGCSSTALVNASPYYRRSNCLHELIANVRSSTSGRSTSNYYRRQHDHDDDDEHCVHFNLSQLIAKCFDKSTKSQSLSQAYYDSSMYVCVCASTLCNGRLTMTTNDASSSTRLAIDITATMIMSICLISI